jgi:hypothetical protein
MPLIALRSAAVGIELLFCDEFSMTPLELLRRPYRDRDSEIDRSKEGKGRGGRNKSDDETEDE